MIDAGADVIVGAHPHVTQNIEWYKDKPIFYSLGNFVFNGFDEGEIPNNRRWEIKFRGDSCRETLHNEFFKFAYYRF